MFGRRLASIGTPIEAGHFKVDETKRSLLKPWETKIRLIGKRSLSPCSTKVERRSGKLQLLVLPFDRHNPNCSKETRADRFGILRFTAQRYAVDRQFGKSE